MGGCVKFPGCDQCEFWKNRNANGTDPANPACNPYTTSDWRPPSRWRTITLAHCAAAKLPH